MFSDLLLKWSEKDGFCSFIWCNADKFVQRHGLSGLCTGMFISEVREATCYGFDDIDWDMINQSNERFFRQFQGLVRFAKDASP